MCDRPQRRWIEPEQGAYGTLVAQFTGTADYTSVDALTANLTIEGWID